MDKERPFIPLPAETLEDRDVASAANRRVNQWMDEAYEEFVQKGGVADLPGYGKPLNIPSGDVWESVMKNANVKPPWLMLRQDIKAAASSKNTTSGCRTSRKPLVDRHYTVRRVG